MTETGTSRLDDYLDVFIAPAALFRRRADGKFGQALVVFVVLLAILYFATRTAMQPIMDAEFQRQMAAAVKTNPSITPEQLETGRKFFSTFGAIFLIAGMPIAILILGGVVWVTARIVGGTLSYAQGATIATFSLFPRLLDMISGAVQALLMDERGLNGRYRVSLGLGRLLDPDTANPVLLALLGRVDVFTIWITVLVAMGLKVIAKVSTAQAAAGAAIVWVIGGLPAILQALRAG
jgi:hypothetical protein